MVALFFFSTDYVFDGERNGHLYTETDVARPVNAYGSSKLAGEVAVLEEDPNALVIRTSGVFGPELQGKNFVYQLCRTLLQGQKMQCATDAYGCRTYSRDLAALTIGLLGTGVSGTFHCVGNLCLSRYEFATRIATCWGLDTSCLEGKESREIYLESLQKHGFAATRGKYFGLSISKLQGVLPEFQLHGIEEALLDWKANPMRAEYMFSPR